MNTVNRGNFGENCPKWRLISQFSGTSYQGHVLYSDTREKISSLSLSPSGAAPKRSG